MGIRDHFQNLAARALIGLARLLPYRARVRFTGWVIAKAVAPVAGWKGRVRRNLANVMPDLPSAQVERIADRVCNNVGRTLIEIYSGEEFLKTVNDTPFVGPGVATFGAARAEQKRMVLVTAHIGNYDVVRGRLARDGLEMAALYKPMRNEAFNRQYVDAISGIAKPVFPTGKAGVSGLVRHLKKNGCIGIVADVSKLSAPLLYFFGKPAHTPVSAAEWAVKYDALLIPIFGLREPDGMSFRIHVEEPIPHGAPEDMMQRYNDLVEAVVRDNIDQWFWIHRRWKHKRDGKLEF